MAQALGPGVSTRITSIDGQGNSCFVYGEGGSVFFGRSLDGKPILSKGKDPTAGQSLLPASTPARIIVDSVL
jgi:hypothetical protein